MRGLLSPAIKNIWYITAWLEKNRPRGGLNVLLLRRAPLQSINNDRNPVVLSRSRVFYFSPVELYLPDMIFWAFGRCVRVRVVRCLLLPLTYQTKVRFRCQYEPR